MRASQQVSQQQHGRLCTTPCALLLASAQHRRSHVWCQRMTVVQVRALATAVAAAAGAITSPEEVTRHLPKDLNPKLREALSEALGGCSALQGALLDTLRTQRNTKPGDGV
jgi:hypothetical protein